MKLVIFASGRGSNFAAIADAVRDGKIPGAEIVCLFSNNPSARALGLARDRGIATELVNRKAYSSRDEYEAEVSTRVKKYAPDLIVLAGYALLLGPAIVKEWANRMVNIHPSLLPAFKGLHAQKLALDYGVKQTGCTVHFVTEELDAGPILAQATCEVRDDDTEDSLTQRLLPIEHATFIDALRRLATGPWRIDGRRVYFAKKK